MNRAKFHSLPFFFLLSYIEYNKPPVCEQFRCIAYSIECGMLWTIGWKSPESETKLNQKKKKNLLFFHICFCIAALYINYGGEVQCSSTAEINFCVFMLVLFIFCSFLWSCSATHTRYMVVIICFDSLTLIIRSKWAKIRFFFRSKRAEEKKLRLKNNPIAPTHTNTYSSRGPNLLRTAYAASIRTEQTKTLAISLKNHTVGISRLLLLFFLFEIGKHRKCLRYFQCNVNQCVVVGQFWYTTQQTRSHINFGKLRKRKKKRKTQTQNDDK